MGGGTGRNEELFSGLFVLRDGAITIHVGGRGEPNKKKKTRYVFIVCRRKIK